MPAHYKHIDFEIPCFGEFDASPQIHPGHASELAADQPLLWFPLDETSGTATNNRGSLGFAANGVYQGGFTLGQPGAIARDDATAAHFNASPGPPASLALATANIPALSAMTLSCWLRPDNTQLRLLNYVFCASAGGVDRWGLWCGGSYATGGVNGRNLGFLLGGGASHQSPAMTFQDATDQYQWRHVAVSFQSGVTPCTRFYKDGQLIASAGNASQPPLAATTHLRLAARGDVTHLAYAGRLAHVAVFDRVLSPQRIATHYQRGIGQ